MDFWLPSVRHNDTITTGDLQQKCACLHSRMHTDHTTTCIEILLVQRQRKMHVNYHMSRIKLLKKNSRNMKRYVVTKQTVWENVRYSITNYKKYNYCVRQWTVPVPIYTTWQLPRWCAVQQLVYIAVINVSTSVRLHVFRDVTQQSRHFCA